jgi:IS5 family transposase
VSSRRKGPEGDEQRKGLYRQLLSLTRKVRNQAQRVCAEVSDLSRPKQAAAQPLIEKMQTMVGRVGQVIRQTKTRILMGNTKAVGKLASVFEAHTEIIRKGKASKPTEFGKLVKIQEAENQIITDYEVYDERPNDSDLLVEAVEKHEECFGQTPVMVAADAGFYSSANDKKLEEKGVPRVSVPNRKSPSETRRRKQKQRWFKRGQRWRTGCEGRISVLKRRHGLNRSRYRGQDGMKLWVGLGVIADNLISLGNLMAMREAKA